MHNFSLRCSSSVPPVRFRPLLKKKLHLRLKCGDRGPWQPKRLDAQEGFTIAELLIATAVFSTVLLLCTYGLLEIGRTYTKGTTTSRTQEVARSILENVTEAIQFGGGTVSTLPQAANGVPGMYCAGTKRFSYIRNRVLVEGSANHVLVVDTFGTCSDGVPVQGLGGTPLTASSKELMATRMRLARLSVESLGNGLYRVTVRVVTGEDNLLLDLLQGNGSPGTDSVWDTCRNERAGSQFCAVSELTTTVEKRQ
jgi:type II secretory pathway pseudopilin PulG